MLRCWMLLVLMLLAALALAEPLRLENGHAYVPLRQVAEWLGADVDYDFKTSTVIITLHGREVRYRSYEKTATVDGTRIDVGTNSIMYWGMVYVPWQFLPKVLGVQAWGDSAARTLTLQHPTTGATLTLYPGIEYDRRAARQGNTEADVLAAAIAGNDLAMVKRLLTANPALINTRDRHYSTPLPRAVAEGKMEIVHYLLSRGGTVNTRTGHVDTVTEGYDEKGRAYNHWYWYGDSACASPLHVAAAFGRRDMGEMLLKAGAKLNPGDSDYRTPLCLAVEVGQASMVDWLLAKGAKVNHGWPRPLKAAIVAGRPDYAKKLVAHGADVQYAIRNGITLLHLAVEHCQPDTVALLVAHGAKPTVADEEGRTPLHNVNREWDLMPLGRGQYAITRRAVLPGTKIDRPNPAEDDTDERTPPPLTEAQRAAITAHRQQYLKMLEYLIDQGADVNAKSENGETPVQVAAEQGMGHVIELLHARGGVVDANTLHTVCYDGNAELVDLVLRLGADPNEGLPQFKVVMHWVDGPDDPEDAARARILLSLKQYGVKLDTPLDDGTLALHHAAFYGLAQCVDVLLRSGQPVHAVDTEGMTPLHHASQSWYYTTPVIELLLRQGAEVNRTNAAGQTPLWFACGRGPSYWEYDEGQSSTTRALPVEVLLRHGADPKVADHKGVTTLHRAVAAYGDFRNGSILQQLVEKGVDINARDKNGDTPLHYAARRECVDAVKWLLAHGAAVNARNGKGQTPLAARIALYADGGPYGEVCKLLQARGGTK